MGVTVKRRDIKTGIGVAPVPLLLQLMQMGQRGVGIAHGNGACDQD